MDCENCRHLTVVGLHDTGPWLLLAFKALIKQPCIKANTLALQWAPTQLYMKAKTPKNSRNRYYRVIALPQHEARVELLFNKVNILLQPLRWPSG